MIVILSFTSVKRHRYIYIKKIGLIRNYYFEKIVCFSVLFLFHMFFIPCLLDFGRLTINLTQNWNTFSFSVLWPTQDVQNGDECTRDFLFGIGEDKQRSARLTAWFHTPENYFIQVTAYQSFFSPNIHQFAFFESLWLSIGIQEVLPTAPIKMSWAL